MHKRLYTGQLMVLLSLTLLVACDDDPVTSSTEMTLTPDELAEAKIIFEGTYALRVMTTSEQEIPVVGLTRSSSVAKKLLRVREVDGVFLAEETFCDIAMNSEGPAAPSVPNELVSFIPVVESPLRVQKQDAQWRWERERSGLALGVRLDRPLSDDLPESADDPAVWDQDEDGHPGVTLTVSGLIEGNIYTLIRYVDTLSGEVEGDTWVGHTKDETEQVIVGASQEVLLLNINSQAIDDLSLNTVVAYPLNEGSTCAAVLDRLEEEEIGQELDITEQTMEMEDHQIAEFPAYADRAIAPPPRPAPEEGAEAMWWSAFHSGDIERVYEAITALDIALEDDPENFQLLFSRLGANTWLLSTAIQEEWPTEDYIEESTKAITLSQRALEARGEDGRVLAFIGTAYVMTGEALGDDDLIDQGWAFLEQGVSEWPEVVLFTWGMNMHGRLEATNPLYQVALDSVFESMYLCFGEVDRENPSVEGLTLVDSEWVRRACLSNEIAPHSNEGFWLTSGDLFLKNGDIELSRILYNNAKLSPSYDSWSYKEVLTNRIEQIEDFAQRWADDNPNNDPIDYGADTPCKFCHQN